MQNQDWRYFVSAEARERTAAEAAATPQARALHLQMAYRYAALRLQIEGTDHSACLSTAQNLN